MRETVRYSPRATSACAADRIAFASPIVAADRDRWRPRLSRQIATYLPPRL
jgi:hypothetical protein